MLAWLLDAEFAEYAFPVSVPQIPISQGEQGRKVDPELVELVAEECQRGVNLIVRLDQVLGVELLELLKVCSTFSTSRSRKLEFIHVF